MRTVILPHQHRLFPAAPPTSSCFQQSGFPKLTHSAVTQAVLLRHAAGWRWSEPWNIPQKPSAKLFSVLEDFIFKHAFAAGIPVLPLREFHSFISQLPSNPKSLYLVLGIYTALESCFLTGEVGVEVYSFTLPARSTEELKHLEQKWILRVIRSHHMHVSQNCLHKTIEPCLKNLLLFSFCILYFQ